MEKKLNRKCPICFYTKGEALHQQEFLKEDGNPLPDRYDVVSCSSCGFCFADVNATQKNYDEYYKNMSKYESMELSSGGGSNSWDMERLAKTSDVLEGYLRNKNAKILDIGAGLGGLLKTLRKKGFNNLYALESSPRCTEVMIQDGINAVQGTVSSNLEEYFDIKFDLIILSHVVEHVYELRSSIKRLSFILNEHGVIYVEVPDASGYERFYKVPFYYFDMEHINHFTEKYLDLLMRSCGFNGVELASKEIQVSRGDLYPICYGFFQFNTELKDSLVGYISKSSKGLSNDMISALIATQEDVVVYGVGSFTKRLLAQTDFLKMNIKFFVDGDVRKHNTLIGEFFIRDKSYLETFSGTVVICSALFAEDIRVEIKLLNNSMLKIIVMS